MTKKSIVKTIFLKKRINELEKFTKWFNKSCVKQNTDIWLEVEVKKWFSWSGKPNKERYTLSEYQQTKLYEFLTNTLKDLENELSQVPQEEIEVADMYINRTLDSALVELIGEVEE
jgi:hypothetical protein